MATYGSESEPNPTLEDKSWHLLAILLKIGHSVFPQHLASQCRLFPVTPDFVSHVTSLPNSPLSLTDNGLVTPSVSAAIALARFFSVAVKRRHMLSDLGFRGSECSGLRKRKGMELDVVELCAPKRRLVFSLGQGEGGEMRVEISNLAQRISLESYADAAKAMMKRDFPTIKFDLQSMHSRNAVVPLHLDINGQCSGFPAPNFDLREVDNDARTSKFHGEVSGSVIKARDSLIMNGSDLPCQRVVDIHRFMKFNDLFVSPALPLRFQDPLQCNEAGKKIDYYDTCRHDYPEQNIIHPVDDGVCKSNTCRVPIREIINEDGDLQAETGSKKLLICSGTEREKEVAHVVNPVSCEEEQTHGFEPKSCRRALYLDEDETVRNIKTQSASTPKRLLESSRKLKGEQKNDPLQIPLLESSRKLKGEQKNDPLRKPKILAQSLALNKFAKAPRDVDQFKNDHKYIIRHKPKQIRKENMAETNTVTPKVEKKAYPSFDTFTIEEEEGSGGYGTVYRVRRKTDGKRVAIKCPHNNAHKNHINNERNMLERFGGRNFIIKFESSFKSDSGDCFVLEHVDHDRPEVLKKEIDIVQLQWYGYCLFRALASLHKEGVAHRDVKPGNFLFSRKLNKGYLIDFNLAMDIKQKYNTGSKSKPSLDPSHDLHLPSGSAPLVQDKNFVGSKTQASNKREFSDYKKNSELNRNVKQKTYAGPLKNCPEKAGGNLLRAQGTEGSGITSVKDVTSTRTASTERLREPVLYQSSRKEYISLLQNSIQCSNNSSIKGPSSQRKRVTAPSIKGDGKTVYLTPMPLHSSTVAAGLLKNKGDGKHRRDGSCVGTKGFRAPEVLFRSHFQGVKVDIWSAGVTLLYMMIGKAPFTGEPEQNIKDIAKLRGSEELWEVSKLHDREVSFPPELLDDRYLQSWDIESWCRHQTKRPGFLQQIPKSLFDLIDKCLTVNPRNRISAEEVLRHEFFASCHEIMKKQRMIQRRLSSDTAASGTIGD